MRALTRHPRVAGTRFLLKSELSQIEPSSDAALRTVRALMVNRLLGPVHSTLKWILNEQTG